MKTKKNKYPPAKDLKALYDELRTYCRRERKDVDTGEPEMVEAWHRLCRAVGVNPRPRWG